MKELNTIQSLLNAPKGQYNEFGGYRYRSCEDILAALKPLLADTKTTLTITDEIVMVGDRFYVKATATLRNEAGETESVSAYAREPQSKRGSDEAQITGATSSYARKFALNGLFAIDDCKDADFLNTSDSYTQQPSQPQQAGKGEASTLDDAIFTIDRCVTKQQLIDVWNRHAHLQKVPAFVTALSNRKKQLNIA